MSQYFGPDLAFDLVKGLVGEVLLWHFKRSPHRSFAP